MTQGYITQVGLNLLTVLRCTPFAVRLSLHLSVLKITNDLVIKERKKENEFYCSRIKILAIDLSFIFNTYLCNNFDNHIYLECIRVSYQMLTAVVAQTAVFWFSKPYVMFVMTFRRNVLSPSAGYGINFRLTLKRLAEETGRL